jgi:hypothetical protein
MTGLRAGWLRTALVLLAAPGQANANADVSVSPTELVFKSPLELVVARTFERNGAWRSLCLEARGGAARVPVEALAPFGQPQLHRLSVSHAGGVYTDADDNLVMSSVVIIRYAAEVWPRNEHDEARYYRVLVMIPNTGGERLFPNATVRADEVDAEGEDLPDGDSREFALTVDVSLDVHCPVPSIHWEEAAAEPATARDGRAG